MKKLLVTTAVVLLAVNAYAKQQCAQTAPESLVSSLLRQAPGLRESVLKLALEASTCAEDRGLVKRHDLLTVIDYSLPSSQPRLFIFDLHSQKLLFRELVAHGKNSGGDLASFFSNSSGSQASSLGLFVTEDTYIGGNGYSLRLRGLEEGVNDMERRRRRASLRDLPQLQRRRIRARRYIGRPVVLRRDEREYGVSVPCARGGCVRRSVIDE